MNWRQIVPDFITSKWDHFFNKIEGALVTFKPTYISKNNNLFAPLVAIVSIISCIFLIGIAIGSFASLFISLVILYFILTKIFGIDLDAGDVFVV